MKTNLFFFVVTATCLIASCDNESSDSEFSYDLGNFVNVETTRPISPTDSLLIVPCIQISIHNHSYDSLVLYHDKARILSLERSEAYASGDNDCGFASTSDQFPDGQTTLRKNQSQIFYLKNPIENENCTFDSVLTWIDAIRYSQNRTFNIPLKIQVE
ncbi:hypothetical protein [Halocola ammonii]